MKTILIVILGFWLGFLLPPPFHIISLAIAAIVVLWNVSQLSKDC